MYPIQLFGPVSLGERQHLILNAAVFQIAWLFCVLGGSWVAVLTVTAVVALHLFLVQDRLRELRFLLLAAAIGFVCDLALIRAGILTPASAWPPIWLTSLWVLFGTTVGYALRLFHGRLLWCIAGGGLSAPLSYYGGARLANVELMDPVWLALGLIGLMWAVVFPLLVYLHVSYSASRRP